MGLKIPEDAAAPAHWARAGDMQQQELSLEPQSLHGSKTSGKAGQLRHSHCACHRSDGLARSTEITARTFSFSFDSLQTLQYRPVCSSLGAPGSRSQHSRPAGGRGGSPSAHHYAFHAHNYASVGPVRKFPLCSRICKVSAMM